MRSRVLQVPGDACSDLTPLIYLTGDLTAGVGRWERVAGSGGIVSSSLLALAEARVQLVSNLEVMLRELVRVNRKADIFTPQHLNNHWVPKENLT